jgi:predicted HD phosphohydrolase
MSSMAVRLIEAMTKSAPRQYGKEAVTELAHALQCADLAEGAGADEELVLACLLHDVGRYAIVGDGVSDMRGIGARCSGAARGHHEAGADLIAPHVPARVAFLIRAHTDAKRYLCATEPGYHDKLSRGSKHTLTLQGGVMTTEEIERAETNPWWPDALRLRRWDDEAKVVGKKTRPLSAWKPLLQKYFDAGAPGS